jgi:hypothetical protein
MGYDLEKKKTALIVEELPNCNEKNYFALHWLASNNVRPIEYSPNFFGYGWKYQIIGEACKYAADAESGMLKPNNEWVDAETYIGQWRLAIHKAKPLSDFVKKHPDFAFEFAVQKPVWDGYIIDDLQKSYEREKLHEILPACKITEEPFCSPENIIVKLTMPITPETAQKAVQLKSILKNEELLYYQALRGI